jgi:fatty-acyl-CoA synthase
MRDITAVLERHADSLTDRVAVVDPTGAWTFRDLARGASVYEAELRRLGAGPGRRIGILMDGGRAHVALVLATLRTGAASVPLNSRLTATELAAFVENCGLAFVVASAAYTERVSGLASVVGVDDDERLFAADAVIAQPDAHPAGEAIIIGTGGTTGLPKGAVYSTAAVWHWAVCGAFAQQLRPDDVELFGSPFFHSTLLTGLLTPLVAGAAVCIPARFDADHVVGAVAEHGVTRIGGAPTMLSRVLAAARSDPETWRSVRTIQFGSTKAPPGFVADVRDAFPQVQLITGYGSTEFGPVTRRFTADFADGVEGGVGRPVPTASVAVVDPETVTPGRRPGVEGEIAVACPWQMSYYTGEPASTADVMLESGAILSGDIGRFDADGYLHLVGRRKDIIITGGENVFPAEVEGALAALPQVRDLAVYGVVDETWGERIELALALQSSGGAAPTLAEVRRFAQDRLAAYKLPRSLVVLDDLPLTSNNKIDKRRLAADGTLPREIWPAIGGAES